MDILGTVMGGLSGALGQARYELRAGIFRDRELEVLSFEGVEALNTPFVYDVVFATSVDEGELQAEVFGFQACLTISVPNHDARVIQGVAVGLEAVGDAHSDDATERRTFSVRIAPSLWLLGHTRAYRVFQNRSALEIVKAVLRDAGIPVTVFARDEDHPQIPFVYQHGEDDLSFIGRVLATAGTFYYFEHSNGLLSSLVPSDGSGALDPSRSAGPVTTLVICDSARDTEAMTDHAPAASASMPTPPGTGVGYRDGDTLPYDPDGHTKDGEHISSFRLRKEVRPGAVYVQDWDVPRSLALGDDAQTPPVASTVRPDADGHPVHKVAGFDSPTLSVDVGASALLVTEYQRNGASLRASSTSYYAQRALAQLRNDAVVGRGRGDCARMAPGYRFRLTDYPAASVNGEYVVTEVRCRGYSLDHLPNNEKESFSSDFACVPTSVDPRPAKPASRPVGGSEAAEVVGPMRGEINTDSLGRIQVRFRWGQNANPQDPRGGVCWAKWLDVWGGDGYGTMNIPRVGSEVWVECPQQDGGQPVAVGQLRTEANRPPYSLPGEASKVGIRTNALPPYGVGYSEISIQDQAGEECVHIRAQKDLDVQVLNNHAEQIGRDRDVQVEKHDSLRVGQSSQEFVRTDKTVAVGGTLAVSVGGSHAVTTVGSSSDRVLGNRVLETVGAVAEQVGSRSLAVEKDCAVSVDGAFRQTVGTPQAPTSSDVIVYGNHSISATGNVHIRGEQEVVIECGSTRIALTEGLLAQFAKALQATVSSMDVEADDKVTVVAKNTAETRGQTVRSISSGASSELTDGVSLQGSSVKLGSSAASASSQSDSSTDPTKVAFTTTLVDANGAAISGAKYHLYYGGVRYEGSTDGSGGIQQPLVPIVDAPIYLRIWTSDYPKTKPLEYDITWKALPPASSDEGVLARLRNQGFFHGAIPDDQPDVVAALKRDALVAFIRATMKVTDPEAPEHEATALQLLTKAHGH